MKLIGRTGSVAGRDAMNRPFTWQVRSSLGRPKDMATFGLSWRFSSTADADPAGTNAVT